MPQTATVDDELEKYAKPPAHADEDELEKYASKPQTPQPGSLDEYLSKPYSRSSTPTTPTGPAAEGGAKHFARAFNRGMGAPETLKDVPDWMDKLTADPSGTQPYDPLSKAANVPLNMVHGIGEDLEETANYSRKFPNWSAPRIYHAALSDIPILGPAISRLSRAPSDVPGEDPNHFWSERLGQGAATVAQMNPHGTASAIEKVPEVTGKAAKTVRDVVPSKGDIALKLRETEGSREGKLGPGTEAAARLAGAAGGHLLTYAGVPLVGELGGYAVGPKIADSLIPNLPVDRPLKAPIGATQPALEDFYQHRAEDLTKRGKEQAALDKAAAKNQPAPNPLAGLTSTAQPIGTATLPPVGQVMPRTQAEVPGVTAPLGPKAKIEPSKIIRPTEGEPVREGNEGRAATWTNEKVLDEAGRGNRVGITQAILRGLPLPENARYVMGDPDTARAVLNPREVTRFTPEGEPIRNKENPFTQEPSARIPTIGRTPRTIPPVEPVAPTGPQPGVLQFPGPLPESAPLAPAKAVGETPQTTAQPISKAEAPTLLEPLPPLGIKPLENAKPIMETAREEVAKPAAKSIIPNVGEEEPQEVHIKGITAPEPKATSTSRRAKIEPVEKRFSQHEIVDAEGLLASEAGAMAASDRPGTYFDESTEGEHVLTRNQRQGIDRMGGSWRSVKSGRDMHPFMRENPKVNPNDVLKALRNKDSAAYNRLIEKAVDFNRRHPSDAMEFIRGLGENPDAEPENTAAEATFNPEELEPTQQQPKPAVIPKLGETGVIPGMEKAVEAQKAGAAKVAGENLTAEANKPKDISAAAGRMETLSPLFRGTEASPQKEIFGNTPAPTANTPPPAIQQAIEGTDWKFEGRNNLGLYTIQEPGTKIRISLFERELHPEFIKRKIAEKEKQFGAPEK